MMEVGRLCVKIAGRDAGMSCLIVDILKDNFVLIDGQTRRRKCNMKHLEPLETVVKISSGADSATVTSELKKLNIVVMERKTKERKERPKKVIKHKLREKKEKVVKKVTKKDEKKEDSSLEKAVGGSDEKPKKAVKKKVTKKVEEVKK